MTRTKANRIAKSTITFTRYWRAMVRKRIDIDDANTKNVEMERKRKIKL